MASETYTPEAVTPPTIVHTASGAVVVAPRPARTGHSSEVAVEHDGHAEHGHHTLLHHHFDDIEQQRETTTLGMWAFLVTEVMMFGGLFFVYTLYRHMYFGAYFAGSHHLNWQLGTVNTGVLLVSSLTMALAVHAAQMQERQKLVRWLIVTMILGTIFLVVKYFEWSHDYHIGLVPGLAWFYYQQPQHAHEVQELANLGVNANQVMLFFVIYFCMTGLHAIHMIVGLIMMSIMTWLSWKGKFMNGNDQPVEIAGLYWHLIDIVWIFLFPLLYLTGGVKFGGGGH